MNSDDVTPKGESEEPTAAPDPRPQPRYGEYAPLGEVPPQQPSAAADETSEQPTQPTQPLPGASTPGTGQTGTPSSERTGASVSSQPGQAYRPGQPYQPGQSYRPGGASVPPQAGQRYPGSSYPSSYGTPQGAPQNRGTVPTQPTQPLPPAFGGTGGAGTGGSGNGGSSNGSPNRRRGVGAGSIAILLAGALVGGAAGGGIVWGVTSANSHTTTSTTATTSQATNLVVNNSDSVSAVTGAVSVAQPSVVTIESSASSSSRLSTSESATGSGVILSSDGYIVTNNHVVTIDGETSDPTLTVITSDGKVYTASVVGLDPTYDLAVIKIDATGLTAATFADSSALNVGDITVAIGAPLGLSNTVTDGIVSALNRGITVQSSEADSSSGSDSGSQSPDNLWDFNFGNGEQGSTSSTSYIYLNVIQTDAAINPGNSGGALVNSQGQIIGINVAIASASSDSSTSDSSSGSIGVGFAIPSNIVKRITQEIIDNGSATHGMLGASVQDSTSDGVLGVAVESLTSGGAASAAGLKAGDIITAFDGAQVTDSTELTALVRSLAPGTSVQVTFLRSGSAQTTTVTLGSLEDYNSSSSSE